MREVINNPANNSEYNIIKLCNHPEMIEESSEWFHTKWSIPISAYVESMQQCVLKKSPVPQWYIIKVKNEIIAGLGVIDNDFHDRVDLTPNVCAVFVEEKYRCQGIAGKMLNFVCDEMKSKGIETLYLITNHTSFYERYGWNFYCYVTGLGEKQKSRLYIHKA